MTQNKWDDPLSSFAVAQGQKEYLTEAEITLDTYLFANKYHSKSKIQVS